MDSRDGTRAVGPAELARRIGVATGTAGLNNNFFIEAGLATKVGKGKYKPTAAALAFHREAASDQAAYQRSKLVLLLEWLKFAGLIAISDGQVRLVDDEPSDLRSDAAKAVVQITLEVTIV